MSLTKVRGGQTQQGPQRSWSLSPSFSSGEVNCRVAGRLAHIPTRLDAWLRPGRRSWCLQRPRCVPHPLMLWFQEGGQRARTCSLFWFLAQALQVWLRAHCGPRSWLGFVGEGVTRDMATVSLQSPPAQPGLSPPPSQRGQCAATSSPGSSDLTVSSPE